jgi:meiotically up-regulated gene 157 (Mug157) protein
MSIMMRAFTAPDNAKGDAEVAWCMRTLLNTDAGTGFMHESFDVNDPTHFTRKWFAWANTLFGELVVRLVDGGKVDLLNNL